MQLPAQGLDVSSIVTPKWFNPLLQPSDQAAAIPDLRMELPTASDWTLSSSKRALDVSTALFMLALLLFPMLAIAVCVRLTSKGPALFVQERVGRGGRLFGIYKFRSMTVGSSSGPGLTSTGDRRITNSCKKWRRTLCVQIRNPCCVKNS